MKMRDRDRMRATPRDGEMREEEKDIETVDEQTRDTVRVRENETDNESQGERVRQGNVEQQN